MAMGKEMYRSASYWHQDDSMFATDGNEYSHCAHTHRESRGDTDEQERIVNPSPPVSSRPPLSPSLPA